MNKNEKLFEACKENEIEKVKGLLKGNFFSKPLNPNLVNATGNSLLSVATEHNNLIIVKELIAAGADVNKGDKKGIVPLILASYQGHFEIVKELIIAQADINKADDEGNIPLLQASREGHLEIVKELIAAGADVNGTRKDGCTSLYVAAENGHLAVIEKLIDSGAKINKSIKKGFSPLIISSEKGNLEIVKKMICVNAEINAKDLNGKSPIISATQRGHINIVKYLIKNGANVNTSNKRGQTPLHIAVHYGHLEIVKELLIAKADINNVNHAGYTPLHSACQKGQLEIVEQLIIAGADVNKSDNQGNSPISIAIDKGDEKIVSYLIEKGANKPITWKYNEQKIASTLDKNWKDLKEKRNFSEFENLRKAANWKNPNFEQGIKLCKQQLNSTPDFDSTYIVIAEHYSLRHNYETAIAVICTGLDNSKRKSYLLSKLGDIYYKLENPVAAMISYSKSIIASIDSDNLDYVAFLNLAYLFQFSGYENASLVAKEKSNKLSRMDYHSELDFDYSKVNNLQQLVYANESQMVSWALKCIEELDESGWSYV